MGGNKISIAFVPYFNKENPHNATGVINITQMSTAEYASYGAYNSWLLQ